MRHISLFALALTGTAIIAPGLAFADCGNPPVKTAEIVYQIQTPDQVLAPSVEKLEPASTAEISTVQITEPVMTDTPVKIAQAEAYAAPDMNKAVANYSALLERRITRGDGELNLFDYAGANAAGEGKIIKAYTDYLASQNPDSLPEAEQIAYWANLYNALTVNLILDNYPLKSIREVKSGVFSTGPWKRDEVTVNGKVLSLDDIEHGILRKRYPNPALVHYMVNCASVGCPNLQPKLWTAATLDADRDAAAREFINSPRGAAIKGNKLKASSIYDWFKEDFGGSKSATLEHFRKYAGPELLSALDAGAKIDGYDYNWDLNE